jgi:hypothetical protein
MPDDTMKNLLASPWSVMLFAIATMVVTRVLDMGLKERIPATVLKWISLVLGCAGQTTTALLMGMPWRQAIALGVMAGMGGVGSWSTIGKYTPLLKKKPGGDE